MGLTFDHSFKKDEPKRVSERNTTETYTYSLFPHTDYTWVVHQEILTAL